RGGQALDVATGTGELALELARHTSRVIGLDFCGEMMVPARAKIARAGLGDRVKLMVGDAMALPFEDNSFDCATTGFAMRNVTDIPGAFSEMRRVVKSGGRVACLEVARPDSAFVRRMHHCYFFHVVPLLGRLISGDAEAYVYLPDSSTRFPSPPRLAEIMENAGLRKVHYRKLGFGAVAVHWGIK
ncbi:MAG: ubiquinone/menaquinone biosynthesis methyltransferase, partial [Chloroflexi bacterium]|nr:ubiquinone/menaquinone biosynthesis methyltransferase [Chloroflexota bacterium]